MSNNFKPEPRIKNALDNNKLKLSAPAPNTDEGAKKKANLSFRIVKNNPRFIVYTNDPTDQNKNYGQISANFDLPNFYAFLNKAIEIVNGPNGGKFKIKNMGTTWYGGKPSTEPAVLSEVHLIKDDAGVCWISIIDCQNKERPRIKFEFTPDGGFHSFVHGDGTPYSRGETSVTFANGYIKILDRVMSALAVDLWEDPPPPKQKEGGGNRGGGGGYGNKKADVEMDDDIPY